MILSGDIHGNFDLFFSNLNRLKIRDTNIIQVGDFGAGFPNVEASVRKIEELNKELHKINCTLYVIRGNHDSPYFFDGLMEYANIKLMEDYTVRTIDGLRVLFMGGAISIDRTMRTEGKDYWKDEVFVLREDILKFMKGIDIVVTHSSPSFALPFGCDAPIVNSFSEIDKILKSELIQERKNITAAYEILKQNNNIKEWIYGHFHFSDYLMYEGCKFKVLDINELYSIN